MKKPIRRSSGFTIIELLVATAVTALLMTLIIGIISGVMKSWNDSSSKLSAGGQARLTLDQIAQDLQGAILRADGKAWFAVTVLPNTSGSGTWETPSAGAKPGNTDDQTLDLAASRSTLDAADKGRIDNARFGTAGVWLRFFTTKMAATSSDTSLPVAVGYQIVRRASTSGSNPEKRYMLFRSEVTPQNTFNAGYDLDPSTGAYITASGTQGAAGNIIRPNLNQAMVDNIVDFGVRMYVHETNGLRLIYPAKAAAQSATPPSLATSLSTATSGIELTHLAKSTTPSAGDYYRNAFPDVVEIMVRVLTDEGATKLALFEDPPSGYTVAAGTTWWSIVEANSMVYTRRIEIKSQGL